MKVLDPITSSLLRIQMQTLSSSNRVKFEIERRFLVKSLPVNLNEHKHEYIKQGYLQTREGTSIRIRKKGGKYYQTIKVGSGKIRQETEIEISEEQYNLLWPLTKGRRLKKTRYEISHGSLTIELDIYHGKLDGFKTVEVEFNSEKECDKFHPPEWFGAEVTGNPKFTNKHLATHGLPKKELNKLQV